MPRTDVLAARDALYAELLQFRRDADADLAALLQQELAGATDGYQQLKAARARSTSRISWRARAI